MHSWWKTQDFSKIESGPNYTTAAHAFVKATLRLGLRAPFVARKKVYLIKMGEICHLEKLEVNKVGALCLMFFLHV